MSGIDISFVIHPFWIYLLCFFVGLVLGFLSMLVTVSSTTTGESVVMALIMGLVFVVFMLIAPVLEPWFIGASAVGFVASVASIGSGISSHDELAKEQAKLSKVQSELKDAKKLLAARSIDDAEVSRFTERASGGVTA